MHLRIERNGQEIEFADIIRGFDKISKEQGRLKETEDLTQLLMYEMGLERLIKLFPPEVRETIKEIIEEQDSEENVRKRFDELLQQEIKPYNSNVRKVSGEWFFSAEKDTLVIILMIDKGFSIRRIEYKFLNDSFDSFERIEKQTDTFTLVKSDS